MTLTCTSVFVSRKSVTSGFPLQESTRSASLSGDRNAASTTGTSLRQTPPPMVSQAMKNAIPSTATTATSTATAVTSSFTRRDRNLLEPQLSVARVFIGWYPGLSTTFYTARLPLELHTWEQLLGTYLFSFLKYERCKSVTRTTCHVCHVIDILLYSTSPP